jgi:hypothetical protein
MTRLSEFWLCASRRGSGLISGARAGWLAAGFALFTSVLTAAPARAQTDSAAARALFSEGRRLMNEERYDEACPKFEESLRLDHGMGTQFNLAHCWEKLGKTASAWALFLDVAAAARASNQSRREEAARARASQLEPKLTRLRVSVTDPVASTTVTRDGQEVGEAAWGTAMPVDPGDHEIVARAPGKQPWTQNVEVPATAKTFSIKVPELLDAPDAPVADETEPPTPATMSMRDTGGTGAQEVVAIVVGGVGVAALAAGTVFALQFRSDNDEALGLCRGSIGTRTGCADKPEYDRWKRLVDSAKRNQTLSYVSFGVGAASVISAVILYATAGDSSENGAALEWSPLVGGDFVGGTAFGASINGSF